jgi:hypothetical protein
MSRMSCRLLAALVAAMALSAMGASVASATTWHTNKGVIGYTGTFTGTSGAFTLTGPTAALRCTSSTYAGTEGGPSFSGTTWSGAFTGRLTASGCTVGGQSVTITCDVVMTVTNYSGPTASPALSGVSTGTADFECSVVRLGVQVCGISAGAVPFSYTNPSTAGGLDGKFSVPAVTAGGVIVISNGSGGSCPVGVGAAALTALTEGLGSSTVVQPIMWRTNP